MSDIALMLEEAREQGKREAINTFKNLMIDKLNSKSFTTIEELIHYVEFVAGEMLKEARNE